MMGWPTPPLKPGDLLQTISNIRITMVSPNATYGRARDLEAGRWLQVLAIGGGHHIKVKSAFRETGWISPGWMFYGESLVVKRGKVASDTRLDSIQPGDLVQTISVTIMRDGHFIDSERMASLAA